MSSLDLISANEQTRQAWNRNAAYWDARMGDDGNDFVNVLIWPVTARLLKPQPGERMLDIACCIARAAAIRGQPTSQPFILGSEP